MWVPSTESRESRTPTPPSSTALPRPTAVPSSLGTPSVFGSRTVAPFLVVTLSTSSAVEVPPFLVLCRWTTIMSRFCGPAAAAESFFCPGPSRNGSLPAYQR